MELKRKLIEKRICEGNRRKRKENASLFYMISHVELYNIGVEVIILSYM